MFRIIDGQCYRGKPSEDRWTVTVHDLGNGHREGIIQRCADWTHVGSEDPDSTPLTEQELLDKIEANRKRACRRAKTRVRRLCKAMGLDTLLTLTYRANQTDLELCKRHFHLFRHRMRNALGQWAFVATFEQQQRGAWHVHIATHALPKLMLRGGVKVKSYSVVRAIWRDVVGELGGNIDQSRRKRHAMRSAAKVAAYLSKYMMKTADEDRGESRRFQASQCFIPPGQRIELRTRSLRELVELVYAYTADGPCEVTSWLSPYRDVFYVASGPRGPGGGGTA